MIDGIFLFIFWISACSVLPLALVAGPEYALWSVIFTLFSGLYFLISQE